MIYREKCEYMCILLQKKKKETKTISCFCEMNKKFLKFLLSLNSRERRQINKVQKKTMTTIKKKEQQITAHQRSPCVVVRYIRGQTDSWNSVGAMSMTENKIERKDET